MKKYEFTGETWRLGNVTLHRIKAVRDFGDLEVGDLGGWIEQEENLSHEGNCWISGNAKVYDNAKVSGNAKVYCNAKVCDNAEVYGSAMVCGSAEVSDSAMVCGSAEVSGSAMVCGSAEVSGSAMVCGNAKVYCNAEVSGNAKVYGNAKVSGSAMVYKPTDLLTIGPIGSRVDTTTFYRVKSGVINVVCGCFSGSIDDFAAAVEKTHGNDRHGRDYRLAIELAKSRILGEEK